MLKKWPPFILVFLGYEGRKQCLGAWIIVVFLTLFVKAMIPLNTLESFVTLGSFLYTGGNIFDKWMAQKNPKPDAARP